LLPAETQISPAAHRNSLSEKELLFDPNTGDSCEYTELVAPGQSIESKIDYFAAK